MIWRMATWVIERFVQTPVTPPELDERAVKTRRKGVRRTVTILVVVVALFYLIAFMQIIMLKMQ